MFSQQTECFRLLYPSFNEDSDSFQQDNSPYHKGQIVLSPFLEHDDDFTVLEWISHCNRAPLGCGGLRDSTPRHRRVHGCVAKKCKGP